MRQPLSGVLNIDKPSGWTSHDVVARVRRLAKQRRVGHAGTLDPMATGVLLVCLGKATRIAEYLADRPKTYRASIRFGLSTDTWDAEGQVLQERPTTDLTLNAIEAALPGFRGPIDQIPPMYSAIKHHGQPLHRLARRGKVVERQARHVEIHRLEVMNWRPAELVVEVECSKGTYIRSLAHDLGEAVGTGAHLSALVRLTIGEMTVDQAVQLEGLDPSTLRQNLVSPYEALGFLPHVVLDDDAVTELGYGRAIRLPAPQHADLCCAYDSNHELVAILRPDSESDLWQPRKVFVTQTASRTAAR